MPHPRPPRKSLVSPPPTFSNHWKNRLHFFRSLEKLSTLLALLGIGWNNLWDATNAKSQEDDGTSPLGGRMLVRTPASRQRLASCLLPIPSTKFPENPPKTQFAPPTSRFPPPSIFLDVFSVSLPSRIRELCVRFGLFGCSLPPCLCVRFSTPLPFGSPRPWIPLRPSRTLREISAVGLFFALSALVPLRSLR